MSPYDDVEQTGMGTHGAKESSMRSPVTLSRRPAAPPPRRPAAPPPRRPASPPGGAGGAGRAGRAAGPGPDELLPAGQEQQLPLFSW
ncbi:hypothetical protein P8A22_08055 [Streptomyces laculatispora]|uniref:Uncharacterized protein n=1 Tax=Streptomyces laculatispora TaxID=887464 RepID=A0ABY9HZE8_9ACTN|nr:hypothetical protein [Streptomyces laculatispora]WLQ39962.1 hypothetical protein P8A22_08055 [Streptomyces laculatispora]